MILRWGTALKLTVVITPHSCGCIEILALVIILYFKQTNFKVYELFSIQLLKKLSVCHVPVVLATDEGEEGGMFD